MGEMKADPWPHRIVEGFFDKEVFVEIQKEIFHFVKDHINEDRSFVRNQSPRFVKYFPTLKDELDKIDFIGMKEDFPHYRKSEDGYYVEVEVVCTTNGASYPIHDEGGRKIFSTVIYMMPNESIGTVIYDKDQNYFGEIEWKPNRALQFAGIKNTTWHSYHAPEKRVRVTINVFVCRNEFPPRDYSFI